MRQNQITQKMTVTETVYEPSEVCILGCGRSILDLTDEERAYIQRLPVRLALNKFTAFYDAAKIVPSHIFFLDNFSPAARAYLQRVFDICRRDALSGLTFVVANQIKGKTLSPSCARWYLRRLLRWAIRSRRSRQFYLVPRGCNFEFASHTNWKTGGEWAYSLDEPLYHFRCSLTSALNYVSIKWPGRRIKLVGVDLNSDGYFFQEEMGKLRIPCEDWTTPLMRSRAMHFSAIEHEGTTLFDRFDEVLQGLNTTGNMLTCTNPSSLLVTKGLVEYEPVLSAETVGSL